MIYYGKGGDFIANIKDVAKLAGTSVSTVSIVLNKQEKERKIPDQTVERVLNAIKELNYQPSVSARKLREKNLNEITIGVYWASDFRSNYLARFMNGIQEELLSNKHSFNVVICPYKNGELKNEKGIKNFSTFNFAIIAATSEEDTLYLENNDFPIPIVVFNRITNKFHTVINDNESAGKKAVDFFMKKGVNEICTVISDSKYIANRMRSDSVYEHCRRNNITISDKFEIVTENSYIGGYNAALAYSKLFNPPKVIFCDTDTIAKGMLNALYKLNYRVPEDVEILAIGLDSPESSAFTVPSLSIINVPIETMAAECIRLINDLIANKINDVQQRIFETQLIIRDSSPSQ